jgi:hypothetical protein
MYLFFIISMRANSFQGPLMDPENRDFLGPKMATSFEIFRAHPLPMAQVMDLAPSNSLSASAIYLRLSST